MTCNNVKRQVGYWVKVRQYVDTGRFKLVDLFILDRSTLHYCTCPRCRVSHNILPKEKSPT